MGLPCKTIIIEGVEYDLSPSGSNEPAYSRRFASGVAFNTMWADIISKIDLSKLRVGASTLVFPCSAISSDVSLTLISKSTSGLTFTGAEFNDGIHGYTLYVSLSNGTYGNSGYINSTNIGAYNGELDDDYASIMCSTKIQNQITSVSYADVILNY